MGWCLKPRSAMDSPQKGESNNSPTSDSDVVARRFCPFTVAGVESQLGSFSGEEENNDRVPALFASIGSLVVSLAGGDDDDDDTVDSASDRPAPVRVRRTYSGKSGQKSSASTAAFTQMKETQDSSVTLASTESASQQSSSLKPTTHHVERHRRAKRTRKRSAVAANPTESAPFPKAGVRLSFILREFLRQCGGIEAIQGWTTTEVCERIIKPRTEQEGISFCELLRRQGHPAYGETAEIFISHAHSYVFLDVISALQWHLRDHMDAVIWFDMFSVNQHQPTQWSFEWLNSTFKSAIGEIGHVVMVMSPWNDPLPFTRAWCVFEAYCAAVTDSKFEIAMSEADQDLFLEDVKSKPKRSIDQMLATIRADRSQCSVEEDRRRIYSVIRDTVGFVKLDTMIFERYREWVIQVSTEALNRSTEERKRLDLLVTVGKLHQGQGKYTEAAIYLKEHYEKAETEYGSDSAKFLSSMNNLAEVYASQGNHDTAESLCTHCLYKRRTVLGEDHPDTLTSISNLASLFASQGNYEKAKPLFEECLEKQKQVLGPDHPATLLSLNNLAEFYRKQGDYEHAHPLYELCLEKRKSVLGVLHPSTAASMNNLATIYYKQGNVEKAMPLFEQCLVAQECVLGADHPHTLVAMSNLAIFYSEEYSDYEKAKPLHERCYEKRKSVFGEKHPATLMTMRYLARTHADLEEYEKAVLLYQECSKAQKETLGYSHPDTLQTVNELSILYSKVGPYGEGCTIQ